MEGSKKMKKLRKITITLAIVLLCLISFVGIYAKEQGIMKNIVKDYDLAMNLGGYREVRMTIAEGETVTSEKVEEVKKMLEKRLKQLGAEDYLIKADYVTGEIVLEIEETSLTDGIVSYIYTSGNLKFVDSQDKTKVLMTNEEIKQASVKYNTSESGTVIYLELDFTEEGAKKFEELTTNEYKTLKTIDDSDEDDDDDDEEEVTQPKITLMINDTELLSSSFDEPVTNGVLFMTLNSASTDTNQIQTAARNATSIASVLNNGPLPIKYELNANTYIYSDITEKTINIFVVAIAILIIVALVVLIIKYKMPAVFAGISYIGLIALYLLTLRYTNVVISLEGIAGILVILIINYLLLQKLLTKTNYQEAFKEIGIQSIPVIAVIVAFCFINWTNISSFGMTMFWGILLTVIYHFVITKTLLEK